MNILKKKHHRIPSSFFPFHLLFKSSSFHSLLSALPSPPSLPSAPPRHILKKENDRSVFYPICTQVFHLLGPAGIGKSQLLHDLEQNLNSLSSTSSSSSRSPRKLKRASMIGALPTTASTFPREMKPLVLLVTADPTKAALALGRDLLELLSGIRTQTVSGELGLRSRKHDAEMKHRTKLLLKFVETLVSLLFSCHSYQYILS